MPAGPDAPALEVGQLRRLNELLLRQVPAGISVVDRQYRIVSVNAAARRLLGIRESAGELDFLHTARGLPYADVRAAIDRAFRDRAAVTLSDVSVADAGESRHLLIQVAPLPPEGLGLDCVLVTALDVTEQVVAVQRLQTLQDDQRQLSDELGAANRRLTETNKELQDTNEELQAANEELMLAQEELQATNEEFEATNEELQVDTVKDEFLAMASHELRTPLVPLTTYVDVMEQLVREARAKTPSEWVEDVGQLVKRFRKQIADLTRFTDDLLDVAQLQSGTFAIELGRVDLARVVEEAREQASHLPGAPPIRVDGDGGLIVHGDEGRLVQATFNLLANAVRYAGEGGAIDLRVRRRGARARIEVQDYGPGIAREEVEDLFRRFYRGHSHSNTARSGLGLFICKNIAERHGGAIAVDSVPGQGSLFRIELPLEGGEGAPPAQPRRPARGAARAKRARKPVRAKR